MQMMEHTVVNGSLNTALQATLSGLRANVLPRLVRTGPGRTSHNEGENHHSVSSFAWFCLCSSRQLVSNQNHHQRANLLLMRRKRRTTLRHYAGSSSHSRKVRIRDLQTTPARPQWGRFLQTFTNVRQVTKPPFVTLTIREPLCYF